MPQSSSPSALREALSAVVRWAGFGLALSVMMPSLHADDGASRYAEDIQPLLTEYCYACHGLGAKKGGVALDEFATAADALGNRDLWHSVLKNVRAGIMPPAGKPRPSSDEAKTLEQWIKRDVFQSDPNDPDPGRVTLRRLNRVEYRNTIRDLMGINFRTDEEFPADDAGYGFDNIGDVLTVSPLLLEKYMQAAETIVARAVPMVSKSVPTQSYQGGAFRSTTGGGSGERMTYYKDADVEKVVQAEHAGRYKIIVDLEIDGNFDPEPGRCKVTFAADGKELLNQEYGWADYETLSFTYEETWAAGDHKLAFALRNLSPEGKKRTHLDMMIKTVRIEGPLEREHWARPKNFERFFTKDDPETPDGRKAYAREILSRFASLAFRRPVDDHTVDRLVAIAEASYAEPGKTVESGIAQAMVAVLASPRFLFRVEEVEPSGGKLFALLDEYALASRLSYFLWSTMPDERLIALAGGHGLRAGLKDEIKRMLDDPRAEALVENFTGQWLQVRDVEHFPIQVRPVQRADGLPRIEDKDLGPLRRAMRQETEQYFSYVMREDRSILDLIDSKYTFANEQLAKHYGIPNVTGREVRKVDLPEGSPRGGLLTQGSVLMITSNPTRTSPVKRGQFILENFLGTPTPPPPPDIPALEEAKRDFKDREPTVREMMALHRSKPLCASCHSRMDPLGLALDHFNAIGMFREKERQQPIDASGTLLSGKSFKDIGELKTILKTDHRIDFYRCMTEKLMTYALGRGIESHDVESVDKIVADLEANDGRFSSLLFGIIESSPFQKRRTAAAEPSPTPSPSTNGTQP